MRPFGTSAQDLVLVVARIVDVTDGFAEDGSAFILAGDVEPELVPYPDGVPFASVVLSRNGNTALNFTVSLTFQAEIPLKDAIGVQLMTLYRRLSAGAPGLTLRTSTIPEMDGDWVIVEEDSWMWLAAPVQNAGPRVRVGVRSTHAKLPTDIPGKPTHDEEQEADMMNLIAAYQQVMDEASGPGPNSPEPAVDQREELKVFQRDGYWWVSQGVPLETGYREQRLGKASTRVASVVEAIEEQFPGRYRVFVSPSVAEKAMPRPKNIGDWFADVSNKALLASTRARVEHLAFEVLPVPSPEFVELWNSALAAQRESFLNRMTHFIVNNSSLSGKDKRSWDEFQRWMDGGATGRVPQFIRTLLRP